RSWPARAGARQPVRECDRPLAAGPAARHDRHAAGRSGIARRHRSRQRGRRSPQAADVRAVRAAPPAGRHTRPARPRGGEGFPVRDGRFGHRARHSGRRPDDARDASRGRAGELQDGRGPVTKVLVIDDEEPILRALRINLAAHKYEVSTAADGKSGLAAMARDRPDVLILDLGLPDMDGTEVIRGIRGWASVPIIVLSAWGQEVAKIAALDAGADDYVTKPFGMGEL